jgi:hypothetical protein
MIHLVIAITTFESPTFCGAAVYEYIYIFIDLYTDVFHYPHYRHSWSYEVPIRCSSAAAGRSLHVTVQEGISEMARKPELCLVTHVYHIIFN